MKEYWKPLKYKNIIDGYEISTLARFRAINSNSEPFGVSYRSSNGYDFVRLVIDSALLWNNNNPTKHFPIDDLVAHTFVPIPDELIGKPVKVEHIDGNLRNNHYENLRWVEDVEEWRDIPGFEELYQASSMSRIRSVERRIHVTTSTKEYDILHKEYILKPWIDHDTREKITFMKNGSKHVRSVHRTFMETFNPIENMSELQVNHIDEDPRNNSYKNLEWVTPKENANFGDRLLKMYTNGCHAPVSIQCVETGVIFNTIIEAAAFFNVSKHRVRYAYESNRDINGFHLLRLD